MLAHLRLAVLNTRKGGLEMKALCEVSECGRAAQEGLVKAKPSPPDRTREPNAFREFVEHHQGKVFAVAYAMLGNRGEADATAQRVFARLYRVGRWRKEGAATVYQAAIDECLKALPYARFRKAFSWIAGTAADSDAGMAPDGRSAERDLIIARLAKLPYKERILLVLREVAQEAVSDIAEIMRMPPDAVRRDLITARLHLKHVA